MGPLILIMARGQTNETGQYYDDELLLKPIKQSFNQMLAWRAQQSWASSAITWPMKRILEKDGKYVASQVF